jgi:hypothetical protein
METPDKWVVVKLPDCYKVLGTWLGGYLNGDYWRLNRGIESVTEDETHYHFKGYSGSIYKCHKKYYGTSSYSQGILESIKQKVESLEVLDENYNFLEINKTNE